MAARRTLDRMLSRLGLCSRGTALELVRAGRVRIDGRVARSAEVWVDPQAERVTLDGRALVAAEELHLRLNKPKGFLTSFGDPRGRRTVYDLLGELPGWVFPVGRLDRDTSGLLLLTNDTELAERVTNPEHGLEKRYRATTRRRVTEAELEHLRAGLALADGPARPTHVTLVGHRGPTSVVELGLCEGKKHEVRRLFLALEKPLRELRRVAIGPLELGDQPSGSARVLAARELRALRAAVDLG